jgi:5-methylcytosine-specific restriction protein B
VDRIVQSFIIPPLEGIAGRIQSILDRKGQVIVYGPPGTGKTFWALRAALDLAAYVAFGQPYAKLTVEQSQLVHDGERGIGYVRICTFHPAYGYEDFLEGYRPIAAGQQLAFERQSGVFKRLCEDASRQPGRRFFLLIDEINRGDIPRIFGELLTVLEKDKRGKGVLLPLSGDLLQVPGNVFVIGTMNTADRSIALLDAALRRRFGFVELMPDPAVLGGAVIGGVPLGPWLAALNRRLVEHLGRDGRNLQIGHAYFLEGDKPVTDLGKLIRILQDDLIPLLEEYCYEDYGALARILGPGLVDEAKQRIKHELFDLAAGDALLGALMALNPDLATTTEAVSAGVDDAEEDSEAVTDGSEAA